MSLLKQFTLAQRVRRPFCFSFVSRSLFSSPEEAAAERRRRCLLLGMPPPFSLGDIPRPSLPDQPLVRKTQASPSIPKLPEHASSLSGSRLNLHNNILSLLRNSDLQEACVLVRHSVYSNCRPTIYTINAVLSALLDSSLHSDLLSLHRFLNQVGIAPNVVTCNLVLQSYVDSSELDHAISHYRFLCRALPIFPSSTTYKIIIKSLVSASKMEDALQLKDEMIAIMEPDIRVYNIIMSGLVDKGDPDSALSLYAELRGLLGESLNGSIGFVYGSLIKAYFKKGMQRDALELYQSMLGERGSQLKFRAESYNSILEALCKNDCIKEALYLFDRMMSEHSPPIRISMDLESFTYIVNAHCLAGRFNEATDVLGKITKKKISADILSYNNLIRQLGQNGMAAEAEQLYRDMSEHAILPNENTFCFLMEACFKLHRIKDAIKYLVEMENLGVEHGTFAYNTILNGLVMVGDLSEAMLFFNQMMEKAVKRDLNSYQILLTAFDDSNRLSDLFVVVRALLLDSNVVYQPQLKDLVEGAARREKMEGELARLYDEVEKKTKDAVAMAAEEKASADALSREERLRKRAEAKAKQAATTKITKEHIEMHIKRFSLNNLEERKDIPHLGGIFNNGGPSK